MKNEPITREERRSYAITDAAARLMATAHPAFQGMNVGQAVEVARQILAEAEKQDFVARGLTELDSREAHAAVKSGRKPSTGNSDRKVTRVQAATTKHPDATNAIGRRTTRTLPSLLSARVR